MKIGNPLDLIRTGQPANGSATDKAKAETRVSPAASDPAGSGSASVKISSGLADLAAEMKDSDVFDSKRVAQLKAAIANGRFKVDTQAVADKLVASNLEALARSKP